MFGSSAYLALAAASPAMASYVGFNYGSTFTTGAVKAQSDFESEFTTAQGLVSAPDVFSSARLYTMIVSLQNDSRLLISPPVDPLTLIPARRHHKLAHRGHPGCHQHQDLSPSRHVVFCRRRRFCQRARRSEVGHLHLRHQPHQPGRWYFGWLRGSVPHLAYWPPQRREPWCLPRYNRQLHYPGQGCNCRHRSLQCPRRPCRYLDRLGQCLQ